MSETIWKLVPGCKNFTSRDRGGQPDPVIRLGATSVRCVVIHYTAAGLRSTLNTFLNPTSQVSAHLVIDRLGVCYELLEPKFIAWHAGMASWNGITAVNTISYGIELEAENEAGSSPLKFTFTDAQYRSLHRVLWGGKVFKSGTIEEIPGLVKTLHLKVDGTIGVLDSAILGHQHVSPGRKVDPGPYFDWRRIEKTGNPPEPIVASKPAVIPVVSSLIGSPGVISTPSVVVSNLVTKPTIVNQQEPLTWLQKLRKGLRGLGYSTIGSTC